MNKVVYSPRYNIGFFGLERLHPFDSRKYGRAWRVLQQHFGRRLRSHWIRPRRQATSDELRRVHTQQYLDRLRKDRAYVAGALEVPQVAWLPSWMIDRRILRPMRWATYGTILAAKACLEHGFAVNLGGGFHHAKPNAGEGFSVYADVAVAVAAVRDQRGIADSDRIVYVDTDAHQGNGVCHAFVDDSRVFIFDMYHGGIFPWQDRIGRERVDCPIRLNSDCTDTEYMRDLEDRLPGFLDSVANRKVGLAVYNAGTDVVAGDPLGQLNISPPTIRQRDLFVVDQLRQRGIPTLMVLSGGYTKQSYELVASSVIPLLEG